MSGGRERKGREEEREREIERGYMATIKLAKSQYLESIMVRYVMGGVSCNNRIKADQCSLKALKFKDTPLLHWGKYIFATSNYLITLSFLKVTIVLYVECRAERGFYRAD